MLTYMRKSFVYQSLQPGGAPGGSCPGALCSPLTTRFRNQTPPRPPRAHALRYLARVVPDEPRFTSPLVDFEVVILSRLPPSFRTNRHVLARLS